MRTRRVRPRLAGLDPVIPRDKYDVKQFLDLPSKEEVHRCYRQFYQATSNNSLKMGVCGICGRELSCGEHGLKRIPLQELPNNHRLVPRMPHPKHDLFDGKLLEPEGVSITRETFLVKVCQQCLCSLVKDKPD